MFIRGYVSLSIHKQVLIFLVTMRERQLQVLLNTSRKLLYDLSNQWRHQLWGTGARAPPLELLQVVIFTLHVCSVAFPVHVLILQTHFRCSQKRS